ncbi:MAG: hypothetical protein ABIF71_06920 [Planctomycetota bacterium]
MRINYQHEKRKRELANKLKQEEKRKRRQSRKDGTDGTEGIDGQGPALPPAENGPAAPAP